MPSDTKTEETVGERLREARLAAGFETQAALADHLRIGKTTYNAHEKSQNNIPASWAVRYAQELDCDLVWLLTGDGEMRPGAESKKVLRLPPGLPPSVQQAIQVMIDHTRDAPPPLLNSEEADLLSEAVDLFFRVHGDQRQSDAARASDIVRRLRAQLGGSSIEVAS